MLASTRRGPHVARDPHPPPARVQRMVDQLSVAAREETHRLIRARTAWPEGEGLPPAYCHRCHQPAWCVMLSGAQHHGFICQTCAGELGLLS
jgi:hypothetical protein